MRASYNGLNQAHSIFSYFKKLLYYIKPTKFAYKLTTLAFVAASDMAIKLDSF